MATDILDMFCEAVGKFEGDVNELEGLTQDVSQALRPLVDNPDFRELITKMHKLYWGLSTDACVVGVGSNNSELYKKYKSASGNPLVQAAERIYDVFYKE
tara:strand:+ start:4884 stop:5183 length:300 start_codon:yes stop_codon:yes gene_type:complete